MLHIILAGITVRHLMGSVSVRVVAIFWRIFCCFFFMRVDYSKSDDKYEEEEVDEYVSPPSPLSIACVTAGARCFEIA